MFITHLPSVSAEAAGGSWRSSRSRITLQNHRKMKVRPRKELLWPKELQDLQAPSSDSK